MLGRQHDLRRFRRLAVDVADGDLALGVGTELAGLAVVFVTGGCEQFEDLVAVIDRCRHQVRRFAAGIAEHDALVAGTFLALAVGGVVDALADVRRLAVQQNLDLCRFPVEAGLLVADLANGLAGDRLELGRIDDRVAGGIHQDLASLILLQQRLGNADLAGDDNTVGGGQSLAGDADFPRVHAGLLGLAIDQIDDLVGDAVANLVGMTLGNGFRGEEVVLPRHGCPLLKKRSAGLPILARHVLTVPGAARQAVPRSGMNVAAIYLVPPAAWRRRQSSP